MRQDFYRGEFPDTQVMKPLFRKTLHKSRHEVYSKIKIENTALVQGKLTDDAN